MESENQNQEPINDQDDERSLDDSSIGDESTKTIPINRDTILLVGTLLLFIFVIACALIFLVPGMIQQEQVAEETPTGTQTILPTTVLTGTATSVAASPGATPGGTATRVMVTPYPEPGGSPTQAVARATRPPGMPTPATGIPTRIAQKPTRAVGIPTRGALTPYPEPGDGTPTQVAQGPTAAGSPEPVGSAPAQGTPEEPTPTAIPPTAVPPTPTAIPPTPTAVPTEPVDEEPPPMDEEPPDEEPVDEEPPLEEEEPLESPTPEPTQPPPYTVVSADARWVTAQSPIVLDKTVQIAPGSKLFIDAGTEIRLGWGVSIVVDSGAELHVMGTPDNPVRFVSSSGVRWDGIYGRPGSSITLQNAHVHQGGAGGTVLMSEQGELKIYDSLFEDNGGTILTTDSLLDMRGSQVYGNDFSYGGALNATFNRGNRLTLQNNRFGGNRMSDGASVVNIHNVGVLEPVVMDIQKNLMYIPQPAGGEVGANLLVSTNGPIEGTIACNSLVGSTDGLRLRSETSQHPNFRLNVFDNLIDGHIAPITPYYIEHGIGRGATSEVELNMQFNWWGDSTGPYHPEGNPEGRGDSVGSNIIYRPWREEPPACVPPPP